MTVLVEYVKRDGTIDPRWGYARITSVSTRSTKSDGRELFFRIVFDTNYQGRPHRVPSWLAARFLFEPMTDESGEVWGQWKVRTR